MQSVLRALNALIQPGEDVYLVGGCVRDLLLQRPSKDLDLVTSGDPEQLAKRLAVHWNGSAFPLHVERHAYRVMPPRGTNGFFIDVLPLAGSINDDLRARDFTLNALAMPLPFPPDGQIIDPTGGQKDLRAGIIRHVQPGIFAADPVRMLRAARLAAALGFSLAPETEALVRGEATLLSQAAPERIRDEFFLLLAQPECAIQMRRLDTLGLLPVILPELDALKGLAQNANHHLDAWEHTLEALNQVEKLFTGDMLPEDIRDQAVRLMAQLLCKPRSRADLLRFALLLHDVAKPQTRAVTATGIITYRGHEAAGADIVRAIGMRLRLSSREWQHMAIMVGNHLTPGFLAAETAPNKAKRYHFFRKTGDAAPDTLLLSLADRLAARGPWADPAQIERHRCFVIEMLRLYFEHAPLAFPVLPVDGDELMQTFALPPGPKLGALVDALTEAIAIGAATTRANAISFAREWLDTH